MNQEKNNDSQISNRNYYLAAGTITLLALVLRLIHLNFSYSNDELSALSRTTFSTFSDLINKGVLVDFHPAGIQVFLYYWVGIFGMDEWVVRLPFVIAGTVAVWIAIILFSRWFGRQAGLFTGAFLAFTELPLLFSQIARPYGSGLLFSLLTVYFWTLFLQKEKPRYSYALGFALSAAASLYNHHFSGLFAFMVGVTGLFLIERSHLKVYLAAGILTTLLYLPHLPVTYSQMSIGGVGEWLGKPPWSWPVEHLELLFDYSWILVGVVAGIGFFQWKYRETKPNVLTFRLISIIFFAIPLLIGFFYSLFINPVLQHSILLFSAPFLFGFLFSWSAGIPAKIFNPLLIILLLAGVFQTTVINRYYTTRHFGEFRGIAEQIKSWNEKYGENNITRAININNPWYLNFYLRGDSTTYVQEDNRGGSDLDSLSEVLNNSRNPYFMYAWLKPTPEEVRDMILARFPCKVETADFSGMTKAILYSRAVETCNRPFSDTLFCSEETSPQPQEDTLAITFPAFYPGFEGVLSIGSNKNETRLIASADVHTETMATLGLLVFSVQNAAGETLIWKASKLSYFVKAGQWSKVLLTIETGADVLLNNNVKVYLWNPGKEIIFIKNLCLESF